MRDAVLDFVVIKYVIGGALLLLMIVGMIVFWLKDEISTWWSQRRFLKMGDTDYKCKCKWCEDQEGGCPICAKTKR